MRCECTLWYNVFSGLDCLSALSLFSLLTRYVTHITRTRNEWRCNLYRIFKNLAEYMIFKYIFKCGKLFPSFLFIIKHIKRSHSNLLLFPENTTHYIYFIINTHHLLFNHHHHTQLSFNRPISSLHPSSSPLSYKSSFFSSLILLINLITLNIYLFFLFFFIP